MNRIIRYQQPSGPQGNDAADFIEDTKWVKRNEEAIGKASSGFTWAEGFKVSKEEAQEYENPEWLYENLIISGHVIAIPAPPNGGKTTIFMHIAGVLAERGFDVYYVNADVGQSDAKSIVDYADAKKFHLLLPDMKPGQSMQDVVENLQQANEAGGNFRGSVFIFDTLKKMTDVINKAKAKDLYKTLRSLSAKGMTIILLAHTNKYNDAEGRPVYEGTGDLRADVDELIYFIPRKNADGSMTVSTEPDKVRGKFKPITFDLSPERIVTQRDYVNVLEIEREQQERENDGPVIEVITEAIQAEQFTEAKITQHAKDIGIGWRRVQKVLKRYTGKLWTCERAFENNAKRYYLR